MMAKRIHLAGLEDVRDQVVKLGFHRKMPLVLRAIDAELLLKNGDR